MTKQGNTLKLPETMFFSNRGSMGTNVKLLFVKVPLSGQHTRRST